MASAKPVSKSAVQRQFSIGGMKPHPSDTFKHSSDPFFFEKAREIIRLDLNSPDGAVALCASAKTPIQALDRTQLAMPRNLGYSRGLIHGSIRTGTTSLF